jgi:rhodanese-related sulfurtransferase
MARHRGLRLALIPRSVIWDNPLVMAKTRARNKSTAPPTDDQMPEPTAARLKWVGGFAAGALVAGVAFWLLLRDRPSAASASATAPVHPEIAAAATPAPMTEAARAELDAQIAKVTRIEPAALKARMDKGDVAIIDVRAVDGYRAGHIPGALQIPLEYIASEIPYFPRDKLIVTYCSCPAEETSGHAVLILREGGLTNAAALRGGLEAWEQAGLPTEKGLPPKQE